MSSASISNEYPLVGSQSLLTSELLPTVTVTRVTLVSGSTPKKLWATDKIVEFPIKAPEPTKVLPFSVYIVNLTLGARPTPFMLTFFKSVPLFWTHSKSERGVIGFVLTGSEPLSFTGFPRNVPLPSMVVVDDWVSANTCGCKRALNPNPPTAADTLNMVFAM